MHSISVWNMIKQNENFKPRFDKTYMNERYHVRTRVYVDNVQEGYARRGY